MAKETKDMGQTGDVGKDAGKRPDWQKKQGEVGKEGGQIGKQGGGMPGGHDTEKGGTGTLNEPGRTTTVPKTGENR